MTREEKIAVFQPYLDKFETEEMRLYCEDMIALMPDYIFEIPSSTSGKYHNKTQCEPHGQIYHIIMFAEIMNYRLALKGNQEKFKSPVQRDAMRCTPMLHDALKCGLNGSTFSVHEHPMLAGQWVRETKVEHDIDDKTKEAIAHMVERHSGEWTSSKKSKVVLPEPENAMELFVHECDYLSSRSNIDMPIPEYLKDIFVDEPVDFDESYVFSFGKYAGVRLIDVYKAEPDYVEWCDNNLRKPDLKKAIKAMKQWLSTKEQNDEV